METLEKIEYFRKNVGQKYIDLIESRLSQENRMKKLGYPNVYFQKFDRCRDY